jgi:uncharacterized protein (DUF302 family)
MPCLPLVQSLPNYILSIIIILKEACAALEANVAAAKFGVIHMHDVKATLAKKGVEIETESRIYEICNPMRAKWLLDKNFQLVTGLPCRVSIWQGKESVELGFIDAQAILSMITDDAEVIAYISEVNTIIQTIVTSSL